jgi:hypothetical protein
MPETADVLAAIKKAIVDTIGYYKTLAADGLSLADLWAMTTRAVTTFVQIVEQAKSATGEQKKAVVMAAAAEFYDRVLGPYDIPKLPDFIETGIVDPALRTLWLTLVNGLVDAVVAVFNKYGGWFTPAATTPPPQPATPGLPPGLPSGFTPY